MFTCFLSAVVFGLGQNLLEGRPRFVWVHVYLEGELVDRVLSE